MSKPPKPFNGGQWTAARKKAFITSALRGARWPVRFEVIKRSFVKEGINPKTGRKCKLCRCASCKGLFPTGKMQADHRIPCIGPEGFVDWNTFIERLFVEIEGYDAICEDCHSIKTKEENLQRKLSKCPKHSPS